MVGACEKATDGGGWEMTGSDGGPKECPNG